MKLFQSNYLKKNWGILFIFLVSLIPLLSLFSTPDLPHTHDGLVHLSRMAAFYKALTDFQIPVRWAGDLNYGYGLPLFNFIYHFPYLVASVFIALNFGLVTSFKLTLGLSFVLSGIFMYLFTHELLKDEKKAVLSAIFYQFFPFRLIEILLRGSFGEVYAYAFLPLVLYGLTRLSKKLSFVNIFITSFAAFLLVISHNSVSLLFFAISLLFCLIFLDQKKRIIGIFSLCLGLLMSSYYWIPALLDHKYTYGDLFMKDLYRQYFPPFFNFFIPNFNYNKFLLNHGIPVQIGLFQTIAYILAILILIKNRENLLIRKLFIYAFLVSIPALFLMQPISILIWEKVSFLRQFQFPWRILAVIAIVSSLVSVSYLEFKVFKKKTYYFGLIFLVIISTAFYWQHLEGVDKVSEKYYWNFPLNTTYFGETDVIWSAGPAKSYPKSRVEVISGKGVILNFYKNSNTHKYTVSAQTDVKLVDHTEYFPGWQVIVNNKKAPIQFQDANHRGEITFSSPKGRNSVEVKFTETRIRLIADVLSIVGFILLGPIALVFRKVKIK